MSETIRSLQPLTALPSFDPSSGELNVVIETPKGSRNKYSYLPEFGAFQLSLELPEGSTFPHSFGFIPSTIGEDGDPLDVLLLLDSPIPAGGVVQARLLGVMEAEQDEGDGPERNDRILAAALLARTYRGIDALDDLRPDMVAEIERFFIHYNEQMGRSFEPLGRKGRDAARALVEAGERAAREPG